MRREPAIGKGYHARGPASIGTGVREPVNQRLDPFFMGGSRLNDTGITFTWPTCHLLGHARSPWKAAMASAPEKKPLPR